MEITVDGIPGFDGHRAADAAFAAIAHVHACMSRQEPQSDLARLHAPPLGGAVAVDVHTVIVLREALALARRSDGAFNPCFAIDTGHATVASQQPADFADLEILDDTHLRRRRPLHVDLDGIAKGYAVDRAIEVLSAAGATRALVNAGGDLRIAGPGPEPVTIRDPHRPGTAGARVWIENEALATSASYEAMPPTAPASGPDEPLLHAAPWSVTVACARAIHADALTKVLRYAAPAAAQAVLAHFDASHWWLGTQPMSFRVAA